MKTVSHEIRAAVAYAVTRGLEAACDAGHISPRACEDLILALTIVYNSRLTRTLGRATFTRAGGAITLARIEIATTAANMITRDELTMLATHEAAHLVCMAEGTNDHHGPNWRAAHRSMGGDALTTFKGTDTGYRKRLHARFTVVCECDGRSYQLTKRRYLGLVSSAAKCARCSAPFSLAA